MQDYNMMERIQKPGLGVHYWEAHVGMSGQVSEIALVECLLGPTHLVFILNNYF